MYALSNFYANPSVATTTTWCIIIIINTKISAPANFLTVLTTRPAAERASSGES
jgi:hypothetical protein